MAQADVSEYESFSQITSRLDEIVAQVKKKDTSIERSLDLFDEAIALGSKAVDMVDVAPAEESEKSKQESVRKGADEGATAQDSALKDGA